MICAKIRHVKARKRSSSCGGAYRESSVLGDGSVNTVNWPWSFRLKWDRKIIEIMLLVYRYGASVKKVGQGGFSRYRDKHESAGISMECG